jgi:hypothetical protein
VPKSIHRTLASFPQIISLVGARLRIAHDTLDGQERFKHSRISSGLAIADGYGLFSVVDDGDPNTLPGERFATSLDLLPHALDADAMAGRVGCFCSDIRLRRWGEA